MTNFVQIQSGNFRALVRPENLAKVEDKQVNSSIATQQVVLQENGIIRDGKGNFLGRIVEDFDGLCREHYRRGRESGLREALEQPVNQEPIELVGVKEAIAEGGGLWHSCSGCYESNEGAPPKGATFSTVFQCYLGNGCDECGGLGAVWDNTDYEDMARFMAEQDTAPHPVSQEPVIPAFLRRPGSFGHD